MTEIEKRIIAVEKRQEFLKGLIAGIAGTIAVIAAAVPTLYYATELLEKFSR